jgi:tRNA (adenine22-N1)-methyltransferase
MATPLSPRLAALAELVLPGAAMADIGTDHGKLPSWLVATGVVPHAIGVDIHAAPLAAAQRTADPRVTLRLGDGLTMLHDDEVATVVLAGMGGDRITRLLDASIPTGVRRLVLQPNTDWPAVRAWLATKPWTLAHEPMVEDRGRYYVVLAIDLAPPATPVHWTDEDLELGPLARRDATPTWRRWVRATLAQLTTAQQAADAAGADDPQRQALRRRHELFSRAAET